MSSMRALLLVLAVAGCKDAVVIGGGDGGAAHLPLGTIAFAPATVLTGTVRPEGIAAADLDGDGRVDLVAASNAGQALVLYARDATGGFLPGKGLDTVGVAPAGVAVGQLDGKQGPDIVTGVADGVDYFLSTGGGGFAAQPPLAGPSTLQVPLADLDGDGDLDLFAPDSTSNLAHVFLGDGKGGFTAHGQASYFTNAQFVALGSLDGDGRPDVVLANSTAVDLVRGDGKGGFLAATRLVDGPALSITPGGIAIADFDGDAAGHLDVAYADKQPAEGALRMLLGRGDGTFDAGPTSAAVADGYDLAAGDLDWDGRPDLVLTSFSGDSVTVLHNDGQARFSTVATLPVGHQPRHVLLADLDGDDKLDIVTSDNMSGRLSVMLNQSH